MAGRLDAFDMVLDLTTAGSAQTDDPLGGATINEGDVVQDVDHWSERGHSQFAVLKPIVNPNQCSFPIKLACQCQRDTMLRLVSLVFGWVEFDFHSLM